MDGEWINDVMAINEAIVAAEVRLKEQISRIVVMADRGENTIQEEVLLASYQISVRLLRVIQDRFLQDAETIA